MDKLFVKDIDVNQISPPQNEETRISRKDVVRKWSVRKVRRRPQNKDRHSLKSIDSVEEEVSDKGEKSVLVFGDDLHKQALESPLFVSSDEDSATSEDGKLQQYVDGFLANWVLATRKHGGQVL